MKKISSYLSVVVMFLIIISTPITTHATSPDVQQPASKPVSIKPDIVITAFGGSNMLDFAELYNQTPDPIELSGVQIKFTVHDASGVCPEHVYSIAAPEGWLLPKMYFTFERGSGIDSDSSEAYYTVPQNFLSDCENPQLMDVELIAGNTEAIQDINWPAGVITPDNWARHKQRGNSSLSVDGVFTDDYSLQASGSTDLYSTSLYQPPRDASGLQIVEILPHSSNCSPADNSLLCGDYVKLFNSSGAPVSLAAYRLRTSYGGSKSSSSNTITLSGSLQPGQYKLVNSHDDGSAISLTQGGGYVWLEDAEGTQIYEPVIAYPDASADSKIGQSWANDGTTWRWTITPQPNGPNIFTLAIIGHNSSKEQTMLKPCTANQTRNPITNRCRKMASSVKARVPCKADQIRNTATGRCRSILAAAGTKKPCKSDQERSPETGSLPKDSTEDEQCQGHKDSR